MVNSKPVGNSLKLLLCLMLISIVNHPLFSQDLDLAKKLYQDGFYSASIEEAEKFLSFHPYSLREGEALILIGDGYRMKGDLSRALTYYLKASSLAYFADKDLALDRIGKLYMEEGKFNLARKYFLKVIEKFPSSPLIPESLYWIGETYFEEENYSEAEEYFHRLIFLYPESDFVKYAHYSLGYAYFNEGKLSEALEEVEKVEKEFKDPDLQGKAEILKARIYMEKKEFPSALSLLEKLAKTNLKEEANFWIGEIYRRNEDYIRARDYFLKVLESKTPLFVDGALFSLGWMDYKMGKLDSAFNLFSKLITNYPDSKYRKGARFYSGKILQKKKNFKKASEYFSSLIEGKDIWSQRAYISLARVM
ncbi:tetratricopeptide repeat protein, partial [Candidatus Calescamantes bacterium]|nr:tetratricopeptide repeat protein [Candidatus Calescamantes bacterium]